MPPDVLEGIQILLGALGHLAQEQSSVALAHRKMASLAVRRRPPRDLHEKRRSGVRNMAKDRRIEDRPQIVGVGDEGVFHPLREKAIQPPATHERRIQVAVTGRAPLEFGIGWPCDRFHRPRIDLGDAVLHQFHIGGPGESFASEALQMLQSLPACAEAVHQ